MTPPEQPDPAVLDGAAPPAPPTPPTPAATEKACPSCAEQIPIDANFCEACGASLGEPGATPTPLTTGLEARLGAAPRVSRGLSDQAAPLDLGSSPISAVTRAGTRVSHRVSGNSADDRVAEVRPCLQCDGVVGADGYCETCGSKALSERDHFREQPTPWLAGVSDKGIVHHRNEDAMAMTATADPTVPDRRAVLVVMDGVSNTEDSSAGSLAGARRCLPMLAAPLPRGMGTPSSRLAAAAQTFTAAVAEANRGVVGATTPDSIKPASATFTAVVLEGETLFHANLGDSRCYWLPDDGPAVQLTVDDSGAQAQMAAGVPREQAENSPMAHAITQWLGQDSPSLQPTVGQLDITGSGWLIACSDGLWNYASEPEQLREQILAAQSDDPAAVALALIGFANGRGGRDNITAVLARVPSVGAGHNADQPAAATSPAPAPTQPIPIQPVPSQPAPAYPAPSDPGATDG